MTAKIIRIGLIGCAVLLLSLMLPEFYRKIFEPEGNDLSTEYSEVLDEFVKVGRQYDPEKMRDEPYGVGADGTDYDSYHIKEILPMTYYRQLVYENRAPNSIRGVAVSAQIIEDAARFPLFLGVGRRHWAYLWMFESVTDDIQMELPDDMFSMNKDGIHFINTARNRVLAEDHEKSKLFTDALLAEGFVFPEKNIFGMVTTRKSKDDGYFIIDSNENFYHLKMVNGKPYCSRIPLPPNMQVIGMNCMIDTDYYGYIYDQDYNIYLLKRSDYGFFQLPIYNYAVSKGLLLCHENLFFFTYNFAGGGRRWYYVMDKEHNLLAGTSEEYIQYDDTKEGMRERYVFPFRTTFTSDTLAKLAVKCNPVNKFVWLNLLLAAALAAMQLTQRRNMRNVFNYVDILIVLIFGLYGFIGVLVFPNRT